MRDLAKAPELTPSHHQSGELLGRWRHRIGHLDTRERAWSAPVPRAEQWLHECHQGDQGTQRIPRKSNDRSAIDEGEHHRMSGSHSYPIDKDFCSQSIQGPA